jgi:L-ascorbate 6-phosphate lactonase
LVPPAPDYPLPWGERLAELPVQAGQAMLVWIGQSGYFLKTFAGHQFVIDPFLTVWPDRIEPPLLPAADLPADTVLITHTHRDHLDVHALPIIAQTRPHAHFVGPPTARTKLRELGIADERIVTLRPGETHPVADALITAIPARHQDTAPDAQGYVIRAGDATLYHTGDTEYDPCLLAARDHHPALLIVPVNGRGGNMSAEQAAQLAADLAPKAVIPMHYACLQPSANLLDRFLTALHRIAPHVAPAVMEVGSIARLPLA